jgi:hypothetical protein
MTIATDDIELAVDILPIRGPGGDLYSQARQTQPEHAQRIVIVVLIAID